MGKNSLVLMIGVLMTLITLRSSFSASTYRVRSSGLTCSMCPPGTYKERDCSLNAETLCKACGEGEYTAHNNSLPKCLACKSCFNATEIETKSCDPTSDTICTCREGYSINNLGECN